MRIVNKKGDDRMSVLLNMSPKAIRAAAEAVVEDKVRGEFKVNRRAFTDAQVLELEKRLIFDHCWLYLGHVSEVAQPGSFVTRSVAGRNLIFNRDRHGKLHAFYNTCSHRGATVCRETSGRSQVFYCGYHGWAYDSAGVLIDMPGRESMAPGLIESGQYNLREVPQLAEYCGFVFVCFDARAQSLEDYLAGSKVLLQMVSEQGKDGMEIVRGAQQYSIAANWKLLAENSYDGYHAATTHITYLEYLGARDKSGGKPMVRKAGAVVHDLGNGHAMMENATGGSIPWGRPYARWVPGWGEECKPEIESILREMVGRLGEERGKRVGLGDRNSVIFPNLVINDIMAITVRTFFPVAPGQMDVTAWALAPKGESPTSRERRLRNFVEFLGPAGLATPDDVEMLEHCQKGYANTALEYNDISRGMQSDAPAITDEAQMRVYWRRWRELMSRAPEGEV
jgi:p-cumate 2,3-dioxygenase alpha subunit